MEEIFDIKCLSLSLSRYSSRLLGQSDTSIKSTFFPFGQFSCYAVPTGNADGRCGINCTTSSSRRWNVRSTRILFLNDHGVEEVHSQSNCCWSRRPPHHKIVATSTPLSFRYTEKTNKQTYYRNITASLIFLVSNLRRRTSAWVVVISAGSTCFPPESKSTSQPTSQPTR